MDIALGIDTSCYTTSVAALDLDGGLAADFRIPLAVKPGGRGLSQSEMLFQHAVREEHGRSHDHRRRQKRKRDKKCG